MSAKRDLYEAMMACVPSGSLMPAWVGPLIEAVEALQAAQLPVNKTVTEAALQQPQITVRDVIEAKDRRIRQLEIRLRTAELALDQKDKELQALRARVHPASMSAVTARMREILAEDDRQWTDTQPTPAPGAREQFLQGAVNHLDAQAAGDLRRSAPPPVQIGGNFLGATAQATYLCRRYSDKCGPGRCRDGGCPPIYPRNCANDDAALAREVANGSIRLLHQEDDGSPA